jgi:DNA-binding CsgD family transcriptional regulator
MLGAHERQPERQAIVEALRRGRGCLLTGPAGVGKSAVASAAAEAMAASHHVVQVRATTGSAELPLGAFAARLGSTELALTPLVAEARAAILQSADGQPVLVNVDDIDLLDDASAVLVHQLVSSGEASLLATYRLGRLLPSEVFDLLQRNELRQIVIHELDPAAIGLMATQVTGKVLTPTAVDRLAQVTRGNALSMQVLLAGATEQGQLVDTPDGTDLVRLPVDAPAVVEMVRQRLGSLNDGQRAALTTLAFAEPCGPAEVASVADDAMLAALEEAGLISGLLDRSRLVLHVAHPLFGEVLRANTPPLQRRRILSVLANDLAATGARRRSDVLKLARLGLDGGVSVPREIVLQAISMCHVAGDMMLAERLGRAEFDRSQDFKVGWDRAQALYLLGDRDELDRCVASLRPLASTGGERLAIAMVESQSVFWLHGNRDAAIAIIDAALEADSVDEAGSISMTRQELLANRALLFASSGLPGPAWQGYEALGELAPGPALVRAVLAASGSAYTAGNPATAIEVINRGVDAFSIVGPAGVAISIRTLVANRAIAHAVAGDLASMESDALLIQSHAINEQQLAMAHLLLASVHTMRGRPSLARPLVDAAQRWWSQGSAGGLARRWVLAGAAHVYGTAGDVDRCQAVLAEFDADSHDSRILDVHADLGRARMLAADRRPEDARRSLRAAMITHATRGNVYGEMSCAYELVRLDRADEVVTRVEEIATSASSEFFDTIASHARALVGNNGEQLEAVAEWFEARGFLVFANDAWTHAAEAARRDGNQRRVTALLLRAQDVRSRCDETVPGSVAPSTDAGPIALTRREREIAVLAAQGLGNREIAERLFISKRTAENHLARVFEKFGIASRAELVRLLDGGVSGLPG